MSLNVFGRFHRVDKRFQNVVNPGGNDASILSELQIVTPSRCIEEQGVLAPELDDVDAGAQFQQVRIKTGTAEEHIGAVAARDKVTVRRAEDGVVAVAPKKLGLDENVVSLSHVGGQKIFAVTTVNADGEEPIRSGVCEDVHVDAVVAGTTEAVDVAIDVLTVHLCTDVGDIMPFAAFPDDVYIRIRTGLGIGLQFEEVITTSTPSTDKVDFAVSSPTDPVRMSLTSFLSPSHALVVLAASPAETAYSTSSMSSSPP